MRWPLRGGLACLLFVATVTTPLCARVDASIVRQFIYRPDPLPARLDWATLPPPETIAVRTEDGLTLDGFRWPATSRDHVTIVFFHGNGGNRYDAGLMAAPLRRPDTEVIVASYRGYGGNPGKPSEQGLYRDGAAFLRYARAGGPQRIYLFGFSLGAAVALHLAAEPDGKATDGKTTDGVGANAAAVDGVITLGAFSRLSAMAPAWARFLLPDRFDNLSAVRRLRVPHLLMHGEADDVVPLAEANKLLLASEGRSRFLLLKKEGHAVELDGVAPTIRRHIDAMPPVGAQVGAAGNN